MKRRQFGRRQFIGASIGVIAAALAGGWRPADAREATLPPSASTVM